MIGNDLSYSFFISQNYDQPAPTLKAEVKYNSNKARTNFFR